MLRDMLEKVRRMAVEAAGRLELNISKYRGAVVFPGVVKHTSSHGTVPAPGDDGTVFHGCFKGFRFFKAAAATGPPRDVFRGKPTKYEVEAPGEVHPNMKLSLSG